MKRYGNLWDKITSMENMREAYRLSRRGKGHYRAVRKFEEDVEGNLRRIRESLLDRTFTTSEYMTEERVEGHKLRTIYKLPYEPDRIVQHALMQVIVPIFVPTFIRDTFQSIRGRGTSDARRRVQVAMNDNCPPAWAMKFDISKYYPSIDNELMKSAVRSKIKCSDTLWLIDDIIDSHQGLPLGNYVSQLFGNVYLNKFDWWVKQDLGVKWYYRYCDDIVLMGHSKHQLRDWRHMAFEKITDLKLRVKPGWQVVSIAEHGIDFVGYRFYPRKTLLRTRIAKSFRKVAASIKSGRTPIRSGLPRLMSYKGWIKYANAKALWRRYIVSRVIKSADGIYKRNPLKGSI